MASEEDGRIPKSKKKDNKIEPPFLIVRSKLEYKE